jgi:hypothetical protein
VPQPETELLPRFCEPWEWEFRERRMHGERRARDGCSLERSIAPIAVRASIDRGALRHEKDEHHVHEVESRLVT